jgi:hypothetical protein
MARRGVAFCVGLAAAPLLLADASLAQEPERVFCDDTDPANRCPGLDCLCGDDTFEVVFDGQLEDSVFEFASFTQGMAVPMRVVCAAVTDRIRGYSFGVAHDSAFLDLQRPDLTTIGTASEEARNGGFSALRLVPGGFILAIVLNFKQPVVLPTGRPDLVSARYTLTADPGTAGTPIEFVETLGNPPTQIVLTVDGPFFPPFVGDDEMNCINGIDDDEDGRTDREDPDCVVQSVSRLPRTLVDGLVRRALPPFRRGDCDGDGAVREGLSDVLPLLEFLFRSGSPPPCLAACDANGDGGIADVSDAVYLSNFGLRGGPPPPAPFPGCGAGTPADGKLGCESPPGDCVAI